jgi:hypothetical protein
MELLYQVHLVLKDDDEFIDEHGESYANEYFKEQLEGFVFHNIKKYCTFSEVNTEEEIA